MSESVNTSRAQSVAVKIYDYDNLPLALTYSTGGTPINLTNYKFEFVLKNGRTEIETYTIDAGDLSTDFLSKTGASVNVLNMEAMFEDIRDNKVSVGGKYTLIQVVTDTDSNPYAHIIYTIDAREY